MSRKIITVIFKFIIFFTTLFSILCSMGCAQEINPLKRKLSTAPPQQLNDGLSTGSLKETEIDTLKLMHLLDRITGKEYPGIDGLLIIKNGKLVLEEYFQGNDFEYMAKNFKGKLTDYNSNTIHNLASVTKSVTALLCGIAIDKGFIHSGDDKIYSFFPSDSSLFSAEKKEIALWHLLTMTSGLKWNEQDIGYGEEKNDIIQLFIVPDPLRFILSKPLANKPGTNWYYNGGGTNLIGQIVQRTSSLRLDEFAQKYLFDPLEIKELKWVFINKDFVYASGDLRLRPRDMAKLGSLVLNKGMWKGMRIISSEWIEKMIKKQVSFPNRDGYGYQWWLQTYKLGNSAVNSYHASGWGGQKIIILPELDAVIVITGNNYVVTDPANDMMYNYLLPALKKDFNYDFSLIEKEAPLPDSIKIIPPANDINLAALSGHWYGMWDSHFLSCQLVIESIDSNEAVVVYSWADHPSGYFKKGWVRKTAKVEPNGIIKFETTDTLDFRLDTNENVLLANLKNKFVTSKTVMRRKK
jgi:CubicO group peptidase (beta-lactamase class C family)